VCDSAHGSVRAVRAVVCGSALGNVWQCARQCAAVCAAVCSSAHRSVRQCVGVLATVCGSAHAAVPRMSKHTTADARLRGLNVSTHHY
jgi:hypothetical protein